MQMCAMLAQPSVLHLPGDFEKASSAFRAVVAHRTDLLYISSVLFGYRQVRDTLPKMKAPVSTSSLCRQEAHRGKGWISWQRRLRSACGHWQRRVTGMSSIHSSTQHPQLGPPSYVKRQGGGTEGARMPRIGSGPGRAPAGATPITSGFASAVSSTS